MLHPRRCVATSANATPTALMPYIPAAVSWRQVQELLASFPYVTLSIDGWSMTQGTISSASVSSATGVNHVTRLLVSTTSLGYWRQPRHSAKFCMDKAN